MASLEFLQFDVDLPRDSTLKVVDNDDGKGQRIYLNGKEVPYILAHPRPYLLPAYSHGDGEPIPGDFDFTFTIRVSLDPDSVELRPVPFRTPPYYDPDDADRH